MAKLKCADLQLQSSSMYFNYILTSKNNGSTKLIIEMDITLNNLWTAFIPIYYIIGLVPLSQITSEF